MNGARELSVDRVLSDGFAHFQGARIAYRSVSGISVRFGLVHLELDQSI